MHCDKHDIANHTFFKITGAHSLLRIVFDISFLETRGKSAMRASDQFYPHHRRISVSLSLFQVHRKSLLISAWSIPEFFGSGSEFEHTFGSGFNRFCQKYKFRVRFWRVWFFGSDGSKFWAYKCPISYQIGDILCEISILFFREIKYVSKSRDFDGFQSIFWLNFVKIAKNLENLNQNLPKTAVSGTHGS